MRYRLTKKLLYIDKKRYEEVRKILDGNRRKPKIITDEEIINNADVFIKENSTIREVAEKIGVSEQDLYNRLTQKLLYIDKKRYEEVQRILRSNKRIADEEIINNADLFIKENSTVREVAEKLGVSRQTLHNRLTKNLLNIDKQRYEEVQKILNKNKRERHIKAVMAKKLKYKKRIKISSFIFKEDFSMKEECYNMEYVSKGNVLEKDFLFQSDAIGVRFLQLEDGVYSWKAQLYTGEIPALLIANVVKQFFDDRKEAKKLFIPMLKSKKYDNPYISRQKKLIDYYEELLRIIQV